MAKMGYIVTSFWECLQLQNGIYCCAAGLLIIVLKMLMLIISPLGSTGSLGLQIFLKWNSA